MAEESGGRRSVVGVEVVLFGRERVRLRFPRCMEVGEGGGARGSPASGVRLGCDPLVPARALGSVPGRGSASMDAEGRLAQGPDGRALPVLGLVGPRSAESAGLRVRARAFRGSRSVVRGVDRSALRPAGRVGEGSGRAVGGGSSTALLGWDDDSGGEHLWLRPNASLPDTSRWCEDEQTTVPADGITDAPVSGDGLHTQVGVVDVQMLESANRRTGGGQDDLAGTQAAPGGVAQCGVFHGLRDEEGSRASVPQMGASGTRMIVGGASSRRPACGLVPDKRSGDPIGNAVMGNDGLQLQDVAVARCPTAGEDGSGGDAGVFQPASPPDSLVVVEGDSDDDDLGRLQLDEEHRLPFITFMDGDVALWDSDICTPAIMDDKDTRTLVAYMDDALVGKTFGVTLPFHVVDAQLHRMWDRYGEFQATLIRADCFTCIFEEGEVRDLILSGGPWSIAGHIVGLMRWSPQLNIDNLQVMYSPVWVRLPEFPLMYWSRRNIGLIAAKLGRPLGIDRLTDCWGRSIYARVCVRINLMAPLLKGVWVNGLFGKFFQEVTYEGISQMCFVCGKAGHLAPACILNPALVSSVDSGNAEQNDDPPLTVPAPTHQHCPGTSADPENLRSLVVTEQQPLVPPRLDSRGKAQSSRQLGAARGILVHEGQPSRKRRGNWEHNGGGDASPRPD